MRTANTYACLALVFVASLVALPADATAASPTLEWARQLGTSESDGGSDVSADGLGNVYISGYTEGSLGGPNAGIYDAWLAHYDGAGNQTWIRQFGTTDHDEALAAGPDGAGGVYVSGVTLGSL